MKIKIINPVVNISDFNIERWRKYLKKYLRPETTVEFENISRGFPSVETETQTIINGAETLKLIKKIQGYGYDGIFINCFDDPGVVAAREFSSIPVLGPYEPSLLFGSMLSDRLAVISTDQYGMMSEERKSHSHQTYNRITRIINVDLTVLELEDEKKLLNRLLECCRELSGEQIDVVILGCTGMGHIVNDLMVLLQQNKIYMQVVEPLRTGVTMLEYMLYLGHKNLIHSTGIGDFLQ
jgi:allantoin racemase